MDPQEREKLSVSMATDSIKQVLTLSTTILTFTITFSKDIAKGAVEDDLAWLRAGWIVLGIAILAGGWGLLALTGMVSTSHTSIDPYRANVAIPASVQMVSFAAALGLIAVFGLFAFSGDEPSSASGGKCTIEAPATGECRVPAE